jgi:hypothetical protein
MKAAIISIGLFFLVGCSPASMALPSMPLAEREALKCKHNILQMSERFSRMERPIKERNVQQGPKCPVAGTSTYMKSLKTGIGKPGNEIVLFCEGRHHVDAGYSEDYPRWDPEKGFLETENGQKIPSGLQLPLPDDVEVVKSYERQGSVHVTFTTKEDLELLQQRYHKLLNPGTEDVFPARNGKISTSGKLGAIPYSVTCDTLNNTFSVVWDPAVSVPKDS